MPSSKFPVTDDDILEIARQMLADDPSITADEAYNSARRAALSRVITPDLPSTKPSVEYQGTTPGTRLIPPSRASRAITAGLGTSGAMATAGTALGGPMGTVAGGLAGFPIGAGMSLIGDEIDKRSGVDPRSKPTLSADRILDLLPAGLGNIANKLKLSSTGKALVSGGLNTATEYGAGKVNQALGHEDSPEARALVAGTLSLPDMAVARASSKISGSRKLNKEISNLTALPVQQEKRPTDIFSLTRPPDPRGEVGNMQYAMGQALQRNKNLPEQKLMQEIVNSKPDQVYDFILSPIMDVKDQKELKKNVPEFMKRIKLVGLMDGTGDREASIAKGLRESFLRKMLEKGSPNPYGGFPNPDSLRARLEAIGPEVTNFIFGSKDAYKDLTSLARRGSQVGPMGRKSFSSNKGKIEEFIYDKIGHPAMDQDRPSSLQLSDLLPALLGGGVSAISHPGAAITGGLASAALPAARMGQRALVEAPLKKLPPEAVEAIAGGNLEGLSQDVIQWIEERIRAKREGRD